MNQKPYIFTLPCVFINSEDRSYYSAFGRSLGKMQDRFTFGCSFDLNLPGRIVVTVHSRLAENVALARKRFTAALARWEQKGVLA